MSSSHRDFTFILSVAAVLLFANLGKARLWDRDEPRNAGCAKEMLARSDWVVPVFNSELRTHKPILLYWLMMTAYWVFGINEFSARFWSAALGFGTLAATYAMSCRLFNPSVAKWATIALATSLMFNVATHAATPDSALVFFTTLALCAYVVLSFPRMVNESAGAVAQPSDGHCRYYPESRWGVFLVHGLLGFAVLAKGPVGFVLPTAVIGLFLLVARSTHLRKRNHASRKLMEPIGFLARVCSPAHFARTCLSMRPVTAVFSVLLVSLPWYLWVGLRTDGQWLEGFFLEHNLGRAMRSMEGHGGNLFYYPIALLVGTFPWSIFAIPITRSTINAIKSTENWQRSYVFAVCWIAVYIGAFSVARTKLPSYITPAHPAVAMLIGCFIYRWSSLYEPLANIWPRVAWGVLGGVGVAIVVGLGITAAQLFPNEIPLAAIGLVPIAGGIVGALQTSKNRLRGAITLAITAYTFVFCIFAIGAGRVSSHQRYDRLVKAIGSADADARFAAYARVEPSWVFYSDRSIKHIRLNDRDSVSDFLAEDHRRYLIATEEEWNSLQSSLDVKATVVERVPYFLKKTNLVLVRSVPVIARKKTQIESR